MKNGDLAQRVRALVFSARRCCQSDLELSFAEIYNSPTSGRISEIMVPPESLSQYLSNDSNVS
jgi:hypothetical protein